MRALACCLATVLLTGAPAESEPLARARAHLQAGQVDDVLFDLDGKTFSGAEAHSAAELLARAGQTSLAKDPILALQFAQMALRQERGEALALEVAARASFSQKQFDPAEAYSDQWLEASSQSPRARLLRAEIALDEGEWAKAVGYARDLGPGLSPAEKQRAQQVRTQAQRELQERQDGLSSAKSLQAKLDAAMERASKEVATRSRVFVPERREAQVVVYGTSWCGYCAKARKWLTDHNVKFEDKDVERDSDAAQELATKARAAGMRLGGVPVVDVNGTLVKGFDAPRMAQLLH